MINGTYSTKIQSCLKALNQIGYSTESVQSKYAGVTFANSNISKSDLFANLLNNQISTTETAFLNTRCALPHFQDKRAPYEYGIDLILGWLIEDAMLEALQHKGLESKLSGNDRNREFLTVREISTQPDILIKSNPPKLLEIFSDWKGTWQKYGHADLRDNKFIKLKNENAFLLGISPSDSLGFLIDFSTQSDVFSFSPAIRGYGFKPGYSCSSIKNYLEPLDSLLDKLAVRINSLRPSEIL